MEQIRSRKNQYILHLRALAKTNDARRDAGEYVCDGEKLLREALQFGAEVTSVLWREAAAFSLPDGIAQYAADAELVEYASPLMHSPGPVFTVRIPVMCLPEPLRHVIVLEGVQDPGNVGTILRTADAAGFDGAILGPGCADLYGAKTLRATMGSVFRVPVLPTNDLPGTLEAMKREGYAVAATELGGQDFYACCPRGKAILVIGSEGQGISKPVRDAATHHLALPMRGGAESLNAAVAAGILIYELARQMHAE